MGKRGEIGRHIAISIEFKGHQSQMALEFMMTYGWAIMVAMIAVSAIAYFGVLNPDRFFPTACTLESGIGCTDFKVNEGNVILVLRNGRGEDISISNIAAMNCTGSASGPLRNGDQGVFIVDGCRNAADSKFVSDLNITYTGESGITHSNAGRIVGKIESGGATPPTVSSIPIGLAAAAGNAQITLSWSAPSSDGGAEIIMYRVYKGTSSGSENYFASSTFTGYIDNSVTNGQTYYYQVTAVNSIGESNKSNEANAMPCNPSIIATYGSWGACSATCGGGTQSRTNVNQCGQNVQESQSCNTQCCPVNGGWGDYGSWSAWSQCPTVCGAGTQTRTRTRACNNPTPSCGGAQCQGSNSETQSQGCTDNSGLTIATSCGSWGSCSTVCGNGLQYRTCNNQCGSTFQQNQSCYDNSGETITVSCGSWGACSTACGAGTQTRSCTSQCSSTITQTQSCTDTSGYRQIIECTDWDDCEPNEDFPQGPPARYKWCLNSCGIWNRDTGCDCPC